MSSVACTLFLCTTRYAGFLVFKRTSHCFFLLLSLCFVAFSSFNNCLVNGKLNSLSSCFSSQVIHTCLKTLWMQTLNYQTLSTISCLLPSIKVHGCHLPKVSLFHVNIEALTLINKSPTIGSHIDKGFLRYLPHRLI